MNYNDIIVYDFETGGRNPYKTQPTQLAAVVVNGRRLTLTPNAEFNSLMKPLRDEEAIKLGLDPVEDEALEKTHKTWELLEKAPAPKVVWKRFCDFVNTHNYKKDKWSAPIPAGFNNNGYDDIIINRLAGQEPWKFGPTDPDRGNECTLFHPIHNIDVMKMVWSWTENNPDIRSISMDSMRDYLGLSSDMGHDALTDVKQTAYILICYLKMQRTFSKKVKFKKAFADKGL